jgi:tetratricopeptide (TPR) repeat protein
MLARASEMSADYVFPNSPQAASILREAIKRQPKDWKARYYLGNFLFEQSAKKEAVALWEEALAINSSYSVLHRNLGLVAYKVDKNYWSAVYHYENAISRKDDDISLYCDLATIYTEHTKEYGKARELLEKIVVEKNCKRADIIYLLARSYNYMGDYDKAIALLDADTYSNWEGRGSLYAIYTEAHIGKGEKLYQQGNYEAAYKEFSASIDYPESLGPGVMEDPETARSRYWIGLTLEKIGKKEDAKKQWKLAADQSGKGNEENKKYALQAKQKLQ